MQILPTSSTSGSVMDSALSSGRDDRGFSQLVSGLMQDAPAEVTPVIESSQPVSHAQSDSNAHSSVQSDAHNDAAVEKDTPVGENDPFVSEAPYTQTDTSLNAGYTQEEVRYTSSEMEKIADALKKAGVDQEIIDQMLKMSGSPMGVTAEEMIRSMMQTIRKTAKLTDTDMANIQSLAQRIDPSGALGEGLLSDVRAGRTLQGWQRVLDALRSSDQSSVKVDRDELMSLGKGLGLSDASLASLHSAMGDKRQATMSPAMLEALMTPVQHELGERKMQLDKLAAALEKALGPVTQEAKRRIADEQAASARSIRSVDHSQYLIKDTVTQKGLNQTKASDSSANMPLTAQRLESIGNMGNMGSEGKKSADPEHSTDRKAGKWDSLRDRLRMDSSTMSTAQLMYGQATSQSASLATPQVPSQIPGQMPGNYAPQVLRQLEQGVFSAMRNGTQRLELQLAPAELGTVTVVLTMKNGEISASLRPERSETATLLTQQADQLRFSLEQQGLKVDKVEVQTQLQDERQSTSWQGMDQHNMSREQQARSEEQERMLRLGRIGRINRQGSSESLPKEILDRNMHTQRSSAGLAGSLYIVT